ncbi:MULTISPECIES: hypothetical protein [Streptomyces]|uniref:hypothetical protein n=1 Tax=Streptomyces TaxID=1883 RepID=UPI002DD87C5F|nr:MULTISPECIES: hypothetical protein [unclassified Streptomyces]WSD93708.1 hypothetical protein OG758_05625 [Streptomyces sp. NBC_01474]
MTGSRTQRAGRGAWWATRIAALCPALSVLLAALVMCLGPAAHGTDGTADGSLPTVTSVAAGSATQHHARSAYPAAVETVARRGDCPAGDRCCDPASRGVRAVLSAPAQPHPAVLPRMPAATMPDAPPPSPSGLPPSGTAPDLHVLQIQRT